MLWLDPTNPDAFPDGLVDAMVETAAAAATEWGGSQRSKEEQLRAQMRADALRPLGDDEDDLPKSAHASGSPPASLPPRTIEDAAQFLRLDVSTYATFLPRRTPNQPFALPFVSLSPSLTNFFVTMTSPSNA